MKNKIFLTAFFVLLIFSKIFNTFSQKEQHPIDKWLESCMEKGGYTTPVMANCAVEAGKKWDAELNKYYQLLRGKLDNQGKQQLKNSELEWIKFRDLEFQVINNVYDNLEGTMYIPMSAGDKTDIVKDRVL